MRVVTSMLYRQSNSTVQRHRQESAKLGAQLSSGFRINSLGDDPIGVRQVLSNEGALREVRSMERAISGAEHLLATGDDALGEVANLAHRVYEMSIQFASDGFNADDRQSAADELGQIRAQMVILANTEVDGRFIFGGLGNAGAPFDASGAFTGDNGRFQLPVGSRTIVDGTLAGGEPFVDATGGPSIFDTIDSLETALRADNGSAIGALVDEAKIASDRVAEGQHALGIRFERLENVRSAMARAELTAASTLDAAKNTDFVDAVNRLRETEAGLQAALMVTARLSELSLTNFIG